MKIENVPAARYQEEVQERYVLQGVMEKGS